MKNPCLYPSFLIAAAMTVLLFTAARAEDGETATLAFSDPSRPGTLKISIAHGDITLRGSDADQISVQTDLQPEAPAQRKDGLRVLTSSSSYSFTEKNNVAVLSQDADNRGGSSSDFVIAVPRRTSVVITSNFGGDVTVSQVTGNIEIKSLNGEIVLADIAGAALVETMNGEIKATVQALVEGKPLSFTSMNGEVSLSLPAAAKANVRLRTHNGTILTDFDEKALVTKTESIRAGGRYRAPRPIVVRKGTDAEVSEAVNEAIRAGAEAAQEVATAVHEAATAARHAARESGYRVNRPGEDEPGDPSSAPLAPMAPLPPMTGGKIVSGTLNGGGTEIRIVTMNGDVTLRKIDGGK